MDTTTIPISTPPPNWLQMTAKVHFRKNTEKSLKEFLCVCAAVRVRAVQLMSKGRITQISHTREMCKLEKQGMEAERFFYKFFYFKLFTKIKTKAMDGHKNAVKKQMQNLFD
jgi:hypothetical protein